MKAFRGAINFVSPDRRARRRVRVSTEGRPAVPVHPQGLDPAKYYTVHELNPAPGRAALPQEGKTFTGTELIRDGIAPSCANAVEASVIELGS